MTTLRLALPPALSAAIAATSLVGPVAAAEPAFDPIVFELVKGNGVDFVTNSSRTPHRHQPETMVSGVALFDFDNDGWLDIYSASGFYTAPAPVRSDKDL